ncbi:MAG TPA: hypothetical protein PKE31_09540 [Pseudomonadota bacterium]|nr:hypothetical protein [Pseudomonadota bacterium]HMU39242.1 hypothetical protein [Pseudomonadota bacterium]
MVGIAMLGMSSGLADGMVRGTNTVALILLAILFVSFVIGGIYLVVRLFRKRSPTERPSQGAVNQANRKRLLSIWQRFLAPLPASVRVALSDYDHFLVFGDPGVGKSALISRRVDWQSQASQFLPSYTADPLLQIYLGSRCVIHEVSSTLLQSASREAHDGFRKLWKTSLPSAQIPTVLIVLKVSVLSTMSPDVLRQQAKLIRGKINLLTEIYGAPIHTRLCLTNMERISGYSEFSRFLHKNKIPLVLDAGGDAQSSLGAALQGYEKHLPRALTTMPVGPFEASIEILHSAQELMTPVRAFITALVEGAVTSVRPDVQAVYFFSLASDEEVGNPFDPVLAKGTRAPGFFTRIWRWFLALGIRPLHTLLSLLLLFGGAFPIWYLTHRHAHKVKLATDATEAFERSVRRAQESLSSPRESDVVRRSEREAAQALDHFRQDEQRFRLFRLLARKEKADAEQSFVEGLRQGYLRPALESGVRQRARDKILYALAALYAAKGTALGTLLDTQRSDFSETLSLPVDLLTDYVANSPVAWKDKALLLLPPIPTESAKYPVTDLRPWQEYVQTIAHAILQPSISNEQLENLRKKTLNLRETIERVRRASVLRRVYQMLAEETPLDMNKLFGGDAGVLLPEPWLVDNLTNLELLLRLIEESSAQSGKHRHMSLYQLLRYVNALSSGEEKRTGVSAIRSTLPQEPTHFAFPNGKILEISEQGWLDLLLRSRKRWLLSHHIHHVHQGGHSHSHTSRETCCRCVSERKRKRGECVPCDDAGKSSRDRSCRPSRHSHDMPPFSHEELRPRIAHLLSTGELPADDLGDEYNRTVFDHEVLPLVRELRRAVAESKALGPEDKIRLTHLVRNEIEGYADKYCKGLSRYYLSYHFHIRGSGHSVEDVHTALLDIVKPGSRFVAHVQTVAENAALSGLDDPFLKPLAVCLAEFEPLVRVVNPDLLKRRREKPNPEVPQKEKVTEKETQKTDTPPKSAGKGNDTVGNGPGNATVEGSDEKPKGLEPYLSTIAKLAESLDAPWGSHSKGDGKNPDGKTGLADRLGPLGKSALLMSQPSGSGDGSPLSEAEKFLDKAGIVGAFRKPFMDPFLAVYRRGEKDIATTLSDHWNKEALPKLQTLLQRFPFHASAEREVAPSELDVLNESSGSFFQDVRSFYEPAIVLQDGLYRPRRSSLGALPLPSELLKTVNQIAKLSRVLFDAKGGRQPLRLTIRGVQGKRAQEGAGVQPSVAFLRVGKNTFYGLNQRTTADSVSIEWWNQGAALVGIESTSSKSGRRHTQTLEVADSAWSLFRLLQKSTVENDGESTWRIHDEGAGEVQVIRFVIAPDPWLLFRVTSP